MPKYTIPKPKKRNTHDAEVKVDRSRPRIYQIPADAAIIKELTVGEGAEVILQGKVYELETRDSEDYDGVKSHFGLELFSVEAYHDKGATKGESKKSGEREIDELADA